MTPLADLKARLMKDEAFRAAYAEADAEFRLIEAAIRATARAAEIGRDRP